MTASRAFITLLTNTESHGWAGQDPYDGLESILGAIAKPFGPGPRFAVSQAILRSPLLRKLASPAQTLNPKALGLFLGSVVRGRQILGEDRASQLIPALLDKIAARSTPGGLGVGWGYPFGWQSRYFWAPAGTPNAVVTSTVTWHLLECAHLTGNEHALEMGCAGARYLETALNRTAFADGEALSYTAKDVTQVVNVSALAARAMMRAAPHERTPILRDTAGRLTEFVVEAQREDGSWPYSTDAHGGWEDSFHTGYVLESLIQLRELGVNVPERTLHDGFAAYRRFFGPSGEARLQPRADFPLDAHSAAQGILTYATLARSSHASDERRASARDAALRIADWALRDLWLEDHGHFAYRIRAGRRDEREFTRWVSAWMALAMAAVTCLSSPTSVPVERSAGVGAP